MPKLSVDTEMTPKRVKAPSFHVSLACNTYGRKDRQKDRQTKTAEKKVEKSLEERERQGESCFSQLSNTVHSYLR